MLSRGVGVCKYVLNAHPAASVASTESAKKAIALTRLRYECIVALAPSL